MNRLVGRQIPPGREHFLFAVVYLRLDRVVVVAWYFLLIFVLYECSTKHRDSYKVRNLRGCLEVFEICSVFGPTTLLVYDRYSFNFSV